MSFLSFFLLCLNYLIFLNFFDWFPVFVIKFIEDLMLIIYVKMLYQCLYFFILYLFDIYFRSIVFVLICRYTSLYINYHLVKHCANKYQSLDFQTLFLITFMKVKMIYVTLIISFKSTIKCLSFFIRFVYLNYSDNILIDKN
jgi:hypothetical protein